MRIPIITFAEFAAVDTAGKLIIAGTVDGISFRRQAGVRPNAEGPVPIPALYLVAVLEGSIGDGLRHRLGLAVLNEDKQEVVKRVNHGEFHFQVNRYGRPMRAQIVMNIQGLVVPRPGDYEFVLLVDDGAQEPWFRTRANETERKSSPLAA